MADQLDIPPPVSRPRLSGRTILTVAALLLGLALWWLAIDNVGRFATWYTYKVMGYPQVAVEKPPLLLSEDCACFTATIPAAQMSAAQRQGRAVEFLLFQVPHTFLLLFGVVFLMGMVRSYFSPARTRRILAGKHPFVGRLLAAGLGVVTPFCSCSAVPLFIGFVTAGVPLGATFTFLTAAPLVSEVAVAVLWSLFDGTPLLWVVIGLYIGTGLVIALVTGWLMDRLNMGRHVEPWVYALTAAAEDAPEERLTLGDRIAAGFRAVREIVGRVWPFILAGLAIGTVLHVYISQDTLLRALGGTQWWSVPAAVALGVPVYANPAALMPVIGPLLAKGVPLGTVLAFMMAAIALSLPEFIILRRVLRMRLILAFAIVVATGIIIVGTLMNLVILGR